MSPERASDALPLTDVETDTAGDLGSTPNPTLRTMSVPSSSGELPESNIDFRTRASSDLIHAKRQLDLLRQLTSKIALPDDQMQTLQESYDHLQGTVDDLLKADVGSEEYAEYCVSFNLASEGFHSWWARYEAEQTLRELSAKREKSLLRCYGSVRGSELATPN